jgi:hypothetical protein
MPVEANGDAFRQLARAYRQLDKDTKIEVRKALQAATRPVKQEIAAAAREVLPHRGGLGDWAAANRTVTQIRLGGGNPTIRVTTSKEGQALKARKRKTKSRGRGKKKFYDHSAGADMRALNNGRVRHPYWGRGMTPPSQIQLVPGRLGKGGSGFFDVAAERTGDKARVEIIAALRRAANGMPPRISS